LSIWLAIVNFIKKPGYNVYNEDLSEQHNVLLIDYNEDLHYKQTEVRYKNCTTINSLQTDRHSL